MEKVAEGKSVGEGKRRDHTNTSVAQPLKGGTRGGPRGNPGEKKKTVLAVARVARRRAPLAQLLLGSPLPSLGKKPSQRYTAKKRMLFKKKNPYLSVGLP